MEKNKEIKRILDDRDDEENDDSTGKKRKLFCAKTFRKELHGNDRLKSLQNFADIANNKIQDVALEYLEAGGSVNELLSLLDLTAKGDLTTAVPVFRAVYFVIIRAVTCDSKYKNEIDKGIRYLLETFMTTIHAMIQINSSRPRKVVLKLLTGIVTFNQSFGREILSSVKFTPSMIEDFTVPSTGKDSLRKSFIFFVLSFLVQGNTMAIQALLEIKGLLNSIIPGLKFDEAAIVNLVLRVLKENILENSNIMKTLKLNVFNTKIVQSLFELYDWKGPRNIKANIESKKSKNAKEVEVFPEDKQLVIESVHSFLVVLCTSKKHGILFVDKTIGTSSMNYNELLLTVLNGLEVFWENEDVSKIVAEILANCPDLIKTVLSKMEISLQPRESVQWLKAISFVEMLLKLLNAAAIMEVMDVGVNQKITIIQSLSIPLSVVKNMSLGVQKSQPLPVQYHSLRLMILMWDKAQEFISVFQSHQNRLKKSIIHSFLNFLPTFDDLISSWRSLCTEKLQSKKSPLPKLEKSSVLLAILDAIKIINECGQDGADTLGSTAIEMMNHLENLKKEFTDEQLSEVQIKILQLVTIVDPSFLTHDSELFKNALGILLKMDDEISLSTLSRILINSGLFENNEGEIDIWLYCYYALPEENRESVAKSFIECISQAFSKQVDVSDGQYDSIADVSEKKAILLELMETDLVDVSKCGKVNFEALTPVMVQCLQYLELIKKKKFFKNYINDVILNLLHFYNKNVVIKACEKYKQHLTSSLCEYLEAWRNKNFIDCTMDVFQNDSHKKLIDWLWEKRKIKNIPEIFKNSTLIEKFLLFRLVLSYLGVMAEKSLNDVKRDRFLEALSHLMDLENSGKDTEKKVFGNVLSLDVKNKNLYLKKIIFSILGDKILLKNFNVFETNNVSVKCCNDVVINLLMKEKSEKVKKILNNDLIIDRWKIKFLKQLKNCIRKRKSLDVLNFEDVLNFFEYAEEDAAEVLEELSAITDLNLFLIDDERISNLNLVLVKFIKIYSDCSEKIQDHVLMLSKVIQYMDKYHGLDLSLLDECLVNVIKKDPFVLTLLGNDFVESILKRSNINPNTIHLGKLLLNDPNKVNHFLKFALKNSESLKEWKMILPMLSALIIHDDKFLELLLKNNTIAVWEEKNIFLKKDELLCKVLKATYSSLQSDIIKACTKRKPRYIIENSRIVSLLIKHFSGALNKVEKKLISGTDFHPELLAEFIVKFNEFKIVKTYLEELLKIMNETLINEGDDNWEKYCDIVINLKKKFKGSNWNSVADLGAWKDFTKNSLKICLNTSRSPTLLKLLRIMIESIYEENTTSNSIRTIFEMLISHSEFLKVILSSSPTKTELVQLFLSLVTRDTSLMTPKHIPVILASYTASLSLSDQILLRIVYLYENNGINLGHYEPYYWGEAAVNHYSVRPASSLSLMRQMNVSNVLDLLDLKKVKNTLTNFPLHRSMDLFKMVDDDSDVYDPAFYLPLFVSLLSPGASINCQAFIYKGGLALTIRCLSSKCEKIRSAAALVLARFYNHLELVQNMKQKLTWLHFIDCMRYGTENLFEKFISNIFTLFLARATLEISEPLGNLYTPLTNFVLAKPAFDFNTVPEFLVLFHSSDVQYQKHRQWILEILRDGIKGSGDVSTALNARTLKLLTTFSQSHLCYKEQRILILQILTSLMKTQQSSPIIFQHGILNWLRYLCQNADKTLLEPIVTLSSTLIEFFQKELETRKKQISLPYLLQFYNVIIKILPKFDDESQNSIFQNFLSIVLKCLEIFYQEKMLVISKDDLNGVLQAGSMVLKESCRNYTKTNFYFRKHEPNNAENLEKVVFLYKIILSTV